VGTCRRASRGGILDWPAKQLGDAGLGGMKDGVLRQSAILQKSFQFM
jgi:hypothetical protein